MGTWGRTDHHLNVNKSGYGKQLVTDERKVTLIIRWAAGQVQILKNVYYICVLPLLKRLRMK
jgi:hypothetical protein